MPYLMLSVFFGFPLFSLTCTAIVWFPWFLSDGKTRSCHVWSSMGLFDASKQSWRACFYMGINASKQNTGPGGNHNWPCPTPVTSSHIILAFQPEVQFIKCLTMLSLALNFKRYSEERFCIFSHFWCLTLKKSILWSRSYTSSTTWNGPVDC